MVVVVGSERLRNVHTVHIAHNEILFARLTHNRLVLPRFDLIVVADVVCNSFPFFINCSGNLNLHLAIKPSNHSK